MEQLMGVRVRSLPINYGARYRFPLVKQDQEIGVEFEIEGQNLPKQDDLPYHWKVEVDPSLRGPSAEYVLRSPVSFEKFKERCLPYLTKKCYKKKSKLAISGRCSTHVHVNVQYLYLYQVMLLTAMYYIFEELTVAFTGERRKGNFFCIGASESSVVGRGLLESVYRTNGFLQGQDRYSSVNLNAVLKYGSLEFRALKGTLDENEINPWIEFLLKLRDFVEQQEPEDVPNILGKLSFETPYAFLSRILQNTKALQVIKDYYRDDQNTINSLIYRGIDRVQPFFYEPNWNDLSLTPINENSFKLEAKRIFTLKEEGKEVKSMLQAMHGHLADEYKILTGVNPRNGHTISADKLRQIVREHVVHGNNLHDGGRINAGFDEIFQEDD